MTMKKLCLAVLAFLIAYSSAPTSQAQDPQTSPNRGFGKIAPGFQSFFHVQREHPFFLVDNQGRNAAEIQVYVKYPPGQSPKVQVLGNEQSELNVPLRVVVTNLTTNCVVAVEWLDFDFREDGQASSRGLGTPPGGNPNTDVAAGASYTHTFHFTSVTTFRNGRPVLNEVLPALALQCPLTSGSGPVQDSAPSSSSPKKGVAGRTAGGSSAQRQAMAMSLVVGDFPIEDGKGSSWVVVETAGCSVSVQEIRYNGSPEVWTISLAQLTGIRFVSCSNGKGGWLNLNAGDTEQIHFVSLDVGEKLAHDLEVGAKSCGPVYQSTISREATEGCQ